MILRRLGRSGIRVSALALGTVNIGVSLDEPAAERLLLTALDAGINLIDTADSYAAGESERIVGSVLARSARRDEIVLATKCGMAVGPGPADVGASRRHIVRSVEGSLRRLRTDRIDLFQIHRSCLDTAPEETLGALDALVRTGKVLAVGSSNFPAWRLMECLALSDRHGWAGYVSEQSPYNLLDRRIENELVPLAQRYGVGILPWSPLGGGILNGRYTSTTEIPAGSRAARYDGLRARINDDALRVAAEVATLAADVDLTPGQLALVWLRDQLGVVSPILGPRTTDQLEESLAVADHPGLGPDVLARLDVLVPPGAAVSDFHNANDWSGGLARLPAPTL